MGILNRGLVQVYTGDGKGKTTAALGLAWRMLGHGGRVYICQFCKPADHMTGEAALAATWESAGPGQGELVLDRLAEPWDMRRCDTDAQQAERMRQAIAKKLQQVKQWAKRGRYDLMILDEVIFCLHKGLAREADIEAIMDERAASVELVLTGANAGAALIEKADLVTQMECVKHPFTKGAGARAGIEY